MDSQEREEVYERIPWETLDKKTGDKNWIVYAVAGAITLGALAYSFTRDQPVLPPSVEAQPVAAAAPATTMATSPASPSTVASPIVVAEADLFAVDPERLLDSVMSHGELFAIEYINADASERSLLSTLLPTGIPAPVVPEGVQVFVDWAGATSVVEISPGMFEVEVLVRSLVARGEGGFVRQPILNVTVPVETGEGGQPLVSGAPTVAEAVLDRHPGRALTELPDDVTVPDGMDVVGGTQQSDGSWEIVAMAEGPDGVRRPVTVRP